MATWYKSDGRVMTTGDDKDLAAKLKADGWSSKKPKELLEQEKSAIDAEQEAKDAGDRALVAEESLEEALALIDSLQKELSEVQAQNVELIAQIDELTTPDAEDASLSGEDTGSVAVSGS